jgi:hypothetical protein
MTRQDEWVFTLSLPAAIPLSIDQDTVENSNSTEKHRTFELRQCQPPYRKSEETEDGEPSEAFERISLLPSSSNNNQRCDGWTFTSPFWSLQSHNLLTITYSPAWQVLPEFTNKLSCRSCCSCALVCCCCCTDGRDFVAETFGVQDVVRVRRISNLQVPGIGSCQALQVFLRPLLADVPPVPPLLQQAWQTHASRMTNTSKEALSDGPVITFCLSRSRTPSLLWKVELPFADIAVETLSVLDGQLTADPTHIYINGFQSWSFTGSVVKGRPQPKSALPDLFSRAFNAGGSPPPTASTLFRNDTTTTPSSHKPVVYQSDFFTCVTSDGSATRAPYPYQQLDETGGPAMVLGWLAQKEQFGVITSDATLVHFQMHASADGQVGSGCLTTDWAYAQLTTPHSYDEEPMVHFLEAVAAHNHARPLQNGPLLTGWCSWYVFYEKISAGILRENFGKLGALRKQVPTNVAVVDDGYMTAWGDWDSLKPNAFDEGLGVVSRDIVSNGMRPGLWLAPFAADKHSQLTKDHPDWVIRNVAGAAANSSNCGKFFYGLDATNPAVRQYVAESVRRAVKEWKYTVLKIDFLYAACLEGNGKYDLSMSRAQAMDLALQTIREAAGPDVFLIGCGCPIASGIGFLDAMRVSADTGPSWYVFVRCVCLRIF